MKSAFVTTKTNHWSSTRVLNPTGDKSLTIFGDSFGANANADFFSQWWPTKLAHKLGVKNYTNYCRGATSFYFTYSNFLRYNNNNDITIVLITNPHRYTRLTRLPSISKKDPSYNITNVNSLNSIRTKNKHLLDETDNKTLDYLEGWFMAADDMYMYDTHMLMIEHIMRLNPNAVLIPCFDTSASTDILKQIGLTEKQNCYEALVLQHKSLGIKNVNLTGSYSEKSDKIYCHFTPEFNDQMVDVVFERINTGKWNWKFSENIKHEHTLEHYYEQTTI